MESFSATLVVLLSVLSSISFLPIPSDCRTYGSKALYRMSSGTVDITAMAFARSLTDAPPVSIRTVQARLSLTRHFVTQHRLQFRQRLGIGQRLPGFGLLEQRL